MENKYYAQLSKNIFRLNDVNEAIAETAKFFNISKEEFSKRLEQENQKIADEAAEQESKEKGGL